MRVLAILGTAVSGGFLYYCLGGHFPGSSPGPDYREVPTFRGKPTLASARAELATLTVARSRDSATYHRDAFGPGWSGVGAYPTLPSGCTARDDVLRRDLAAVEQAGRCVVASGFLVDPYTGRQLVYHRYQPSHIEIDHVVALGVAWRSGASRWTAARRTEYANDPDNLLAVMAQANQDKSSKTPDQWRPRRGYWCAYAFRWIAVKWRYSLTVTPAEKAALQEMLGTCRSDPDHRP